MSDLSSRDSQLPATGQLADDVWKHADQQLTGDGQSTELEHHHPLAYRQAVLDDVVELHQVIIDAYEPLRQLQIPFPAGYATVEAIEHNIAAHECYVLLRDGQIAATVTLDREDQPRLKALSDLPFIRWFAVAPQFKGQGDGARLLDWVEQQIILGKHNQPGVMLATASRHPWLAAMYERKGYRIFHDYVNSGEHIVYMAKQLNPEVNFQSLLHV
ncbi:GNAT family N-acetyltransferase [Paenibacillus sp. WLX2291]|uniref:GNAT family N-acetyltransferase n=1 Tax=Paenibacillus sp. WLX2291 TaxID=3296934 RepID=UPI003983DC7A